jgi:hypothetical protein
VPRVILLQLGISTNDATQEEIEKLTAKILITELKIIRLYKYWCQVSEISKGKFLVEICIKMS